jgi:hypothetical protein
MSFIGDIREAYTMYHMLTPVADLIRRHLAEVSLGITAVALMLVGPVVNGIVQRATLRLHVLLRFAALVLLLTAGYGILSQVTFSCVKRWLSLLPPLSLIGVTVGIYLVLAFFARKQGKI